MPRREIGGSAGVRASRIVTARGARRELLGPSDHAHGSYTHVLPAGVACHELTNDYKMRLNDSEWNAIRSEDRRTQAGREGLLNAWGRHEND